MNDVQHLDAPTARAGVPARAVVCANGMETSYLRLGHGQPIVLLAADVDAEDVQEAIRRLAQNFLVIAASSPLHCGEQLSSWLNGFVEGLGITGAHLLVHASTLTTLMNGDSRDE
jgi:hypothetical protein